METKKSTKADLEPRKPVFLQTGLVVSLCLTLMAFEYKSPVKSTIILHPDRDLGIEIFPPILTEPPKPLPPPPPATVVVINEVPNTATVDDDLFVDQGDNQDKAVEPYSPPATTNRPPDEENVAEPDPFIVVEQMPEFQGGNEALHDYLRTNLAYPKTARETGITGIVYVRFIVERDGSISHVEILRGVEGGCSEEAFRVISNMPKWTPGKQREVPVRVTLNMPIVFKLAD